MHRADRKSIAVSGRTYSYRHDPRTPARSLHWSAQHWS
jgi:hypothetical protein